MNMHIVLIDLTAPGLRFELTAPSGTRETFRVTTLNFLNQAHAQVALNSHFFLPFPSSDFNAMLIGLAAHDGNVYSAFEAPVQSYALVTNAPALNIDRDNHASIVHINPAFPDAQHVLEPVTLWTALAGSAQILTNGVKTIPFYIDAQHPDGLLTPGGPGSYSNTSSWYNLTNARTSIGLSQDRQRLVLFTVDNAGGSRGMSVGEVADVLINDYGVYDALNLDGGGSTTLAMQNPATNMGRIVNVSADGPNGRAVASNLAVFAIADTIPPVSTTSLSPAPNSFGWSQTNVTVQLGATDKPGSDVKQIQYSLAGAQTGTATIVNGSSASVAITTEGITTLTYFATDNAGNSEVPKSVTVRIDRTAPSITGLPAPEKCRLWPPDHQLVKVAAVGANDVPSGISANSFSVTGASSEPVEPNRPDILISQDGGEFAVRLRAERAGNVADRKYTLTATVRDLAGNETTATVVCVVPHDQREG